MDGPQQPADEGVRQVPAQRPALVGNDHARHPLVAFLFADIRGFTAYTDRYGAQAAAHLADTFVSIAAGIADAHSGSVRGTWGDQVLAEFASPRDAVRAAVGLQASCITRTLGDPRDPLPVGVGLDIGEPADEGANRSAAALNVAARLCARAGAGEVLSSAELVHLAGPLDGVAYVDKGSHRLKGVARPTGVVLVRDGSFDSDQLHRFRAAIAVTGRGRRRPSVAWVVGLSVLAVVLAGLAAGVQLQLDEDPVEVPPGAVAVIDPDSAKVVEAVDAGDSPESLAAVPGGVWVTHANGGSLARMDLGSDRVRRIRSTDSPIAVVATRSDLWTVNGSDRFVRRFSLKVDEEASRTDVGNQPVALAVGAGALWVVSKMDGSLVRIDLRTGNVTGQISVGRQPRAVAVSHGKVWVANGGDGTVTAVDARTMQVTALIRVGSGPTALVTVDRGIWVANGLEQSVSHIDSRTMRTVATVPVGEAPVAVAAAAGSVWVSVPARGAVVRVDPRRNAVDGTVPLGASPQGITIADDRLWVATAPFADASHIGGTLRVALSPGKGVRGSPVSDPALGTTPPTLMPLLYDGLVTLRKADGADGYDLVPDLAESMPEPTNSGRTYTFTVRRGIRYSDGRLLRPADFRRGIARALMADAVKGTGAAHLYFAINGAQECWTRLKAGWRNRPCDLSDGITTGAHSVSFHLRASDPDFLGKLALSPATPAPSGSPTGPVSAKDPLPGTGPYAVASFTPDTQLVLVRNRYYRPWSTQARPPGYPDRIALSAMKPDERLRSALTGDVDAVWLGGMPDARLRQLQLDHPDLVHRSQFAFIWYLQLNTHEPPFDSRSARRALAFAIDKSQFNGPYKTRGDAACQVLPPSFPGYQPTCRYSSNPEASTGEWHGPDFARARMLVQRSGTAGQRVDVWWWKDVAEEGRYLSRILRRLGYDPRLHLNGNAAFWTGVYEPETHKNVAPNGWFPDYVGASTFYEYLFSCMTSPGQYCNEELDRLAASAKAAQDEDPGLADRMWRRVFTRLDEDAVAVPLSYGEQHWLVSQRVGNYRSSALLGPLFDQMWVR